MSQINSLFLIDDDFIFNLIHTKTIEKANFAQNIKSFEDPLDALGELSVLLKSDKESFPDLIFLDINMSAMDGWEFLEELDKFSDHEVENCKVVILSSSIDPSDIEKSKNYKMVREFISKPLTALKLSALSSELDL